MAVKPREIPSRRVAAHSTTHISFYFFIVVFRLRLRTDFTPTLIHSIPSICLCYSLMPSYVYHVLDSMLCLINRSLSYALIGFRLISVCRYSSSGLIKYRKERQNWSREIRSKKKLQEGFLTVLFNLPFTVLFNLPFIEKVENALHCCSRLSY